MSSSIKPSGYSPFSASELAELIAGIDPDTAEVTWWYAQTMDPYGIDPALPEELQQVGREYFVKSSPTGTWVSFCDLPDELKDKLWAKHRHELAFPAGLSPDDLSGCQKSECNASGIEYPHASTLAEAFEAAMADRRVQKHLRDGEISAAFAAAFRKVAELYLAAEFMDYFFEMIGGRPTSPRRTGATRPLNES
jgi:hypothetical protein